MSNISNELLLKQYSHLKALESDYSPKDVAANVRKHLKKQFPKTKFSVTSKIGQINVSWTDGASTPSVSKAISIFSKGTFNAHNDDAWDIKDTTFTEVFGGIKLITASRDYSDQYIGSAIEHVNESLSNANPEVSVESYKSGRLIDVYPNGAEDSYCSIIRNHMYNNAVN